MLNAFRRSFSRNLSSQAKKKTEVTLTDDLIGQAIEAEPSLSKISKDFWERCHETFQNHGIATESFLRIVTGNPPVLTRHPKQIVHVLENWRSCQFGEYSFHLLITKYPEFLDVTDGSYLIQRVTYLKELACTNKNVWKLLMNSPGLIKENSAAIEDRYQYLTSVMRLDVPEIVKSEVFSKSLEVLKTRHMFLDRLGLFKPRSIRADPDEPTKNHRLYQIVDSSDKSFATKIARVTLFEWETFQDLYRKELREAEEEMDGDDDDESDEE
ncbi:MTERF4 family protein [Megaselia abdita]